jgi:hypothetical protein
LEQVEEHPPDLLIEPAIPSEIGVFDGFNRAEEIISYGRSAMEANLSRISYLKRDVIQPDLALCAPA